MDRDFGAYELRERIGKGGMAWVYLAMQKNLERAVALKILFPHLAEDEHLVERFQLEAKAAAAMRHENVCQVYDFGRHGEQFFIAMEYVEGKNLRDWIDQHGTPPLEIALLMLRDICRGLEHAHRRNIIHRDIKPSNVMFTPEGVIKLMDFGLARRVEDRSGITVYGAMLGTPAYMSPEQARGEKLDRPTTDIFSLGIVCYEMLGGARPFQGDSSSVARSILHSEPRPLDALDPLVPPIVEATIVRMLEKDAERRIGNISEVRHAFDAAIQALGLGHEREMLADFAADPAAVTALLRARQLARHLELAKEAEAGGDATALLRQYRCVAYLDPTNETALAYVRAHDVPAPLGRGPASDDIEQTILVQPDPRSSYAPPDAETIVPSRTGSPISPPPGGPRPLSPATPSWLTSTAPATPASIAPAPPSRPPSASIPPVAPSVAPMSPASVPPMPPPPAPPAAGTAPAAKPSGKGAPLMAIAGAIVVLLLIGAGVFAFLTVRRHAPIPGGPASQSQTTFAESTATPATTAGLLTITIEPDSAQIVLDGGQPVPAPAQVPGLAPGSHTLQVLRAGYKTARRVLVLAAGRDSLYTLKLKPDTDAGRVIGVLRVVTDPAGASVVVDEGTPKTSPASFSRLSVGEHTLELTREGFEPQRSMITVRAIPESTIAVTMHTMRPGGPRPRAVTVRANPSGASITMDEGTSRDEPARFEGLVPGPHRVRASQVGYNDATEVFGLSGLRDTTLTLRLERATGAVPHGATGVLSLWMNPRGAVLIDRAPYRSDVETLTVVLQAGREYQIGLQPRWASAFVSEPVRLTPGQSRTFGYDFRKELARVDVTATGGPAAEILVDGKRSGVMTPGSVYVGGGNRHIDLTVNGWRAREGAQTIKVKGGQIHAQSFTLIRQ